MRNTKADIFLLEGSKPSYTRGQDVGSTYPKLWVTGECRREWSDRNKSRQAAENRRNGRSTNSEMWPN